MLSLRTLTAAAALSAAVAGPTVVAATAHAAPGTTAGLVPELAIAYQLAKAQADVEGVPLWITSGKRSWAEQDRMWRDGIREHGSPGEAQKWVLPPSRSTHVSGRAIDVGPRRGALWLERNGNRYGLCRTYANEWWHFEVATFPGTPCPPMLPSASRRR
ncbi:MAG: M15 family metallopeptidase [Gordonia sp. (in: high G+C Gram-positive bacteria)]|uniref:M15 family metallopeptidase n=1 Tax=Gordonia sp. (in: high G+C Gram-positive bacteria) TaxID=84139 RepID=UPI0039E64379